MRMNIETYNFVYDVIKLQLEEVLKDYEIIVLKKSKQEEDRFPLVVVTEEDNFISSSTLNNEETNSKLYYEINIYARDKIVNGDLMYDMEIARKIASEIDAVLNLKYKFNRISCRPTPNLDDSIYRITMRYSIVQSDNRIKLK